MIAGFYYKLDNEMFSQTHIRVGEVHECMRAQRVYYLVVNMRRSLYNTNTTITIENTCAAQSQPLSVPVTFN